jgi:hypothetical protein
VAQPTGGSPAKSLVRLKVARVLPDGKPIIKEGQRKKLASPFFKGTGRKYRAARTSSAIRYLFFCDLDIRKGVTYTAIYPASDKVNWSNLSDSQVACLIREVKAEDGVIQQVEEREIH